MKPIFVDKTFSASYRRLYRTNDSPGIWSLLQPAGSQNHAPNLCILNEDTIACVWMSGPREGSSAMSVYLSSLKTGSSLWSPPRLVSQQSALSEQNPLLFIHNSSFSSTPKLHLIHTGQRVRSPGEYTGTFSMQWTSQLYHRSKNLQTGRWGSSRLLLDDSFFCRNPPISLNNESLLLPVYRSREQGSEFGYDSSYVLHLGSDLAVKNIHPIPNSTGRVHGSILYSSDKQSLIQFFRSRQADCIYRSSCRIGDYLWSEPTPISLPNNNSSIQAIRLHSGRLLMVFNRFSIQANPCSPQSWGNALWPHTRWPLSLALSEDDGASWPYVFDIEHSLGYCGLNNWQYNYQYAYPSVIEHPAGLIHVSYSWGNRHAIKYMLLSEQDILYPS